jgi:heat-inducible transcriptional repressor
MPELTERQRRILARLVIEYIDQGEPVSSAWLAEHSALGLSSASVRNILARLEEHGLVRQRHTSAGRVPTDSGYRFYVDELLGARRRTRAVPEEVEARLRQSATVSDLFESVSHELSRASHQVAFALTPASTNPRLRHIDFARLEGRQILVIVVTTDGQITHKVIDAEDECEPVVLTQAANFLNSEFAGLTLHEVRSAVLDRMRHERMLYDALMARALRLAKTGLDDVTPEDTLHVQGASFLLDELLGHPGDGEVTLEMLRAVFRMIEEKHRLLGLLTRYLEAPGLTVVIGSEHSIADMQPFSIVASTFSDGERTGAVGIIGPTRMRYQRAISAVDSMSAAMSRVWEEK